MYIRTDTYVLTGKPRRIIVEDVTDYRGGRNGLL